VKKPTVIVSDTTPECILQSMREEAAEAGWSNAEIQLLEERATNGDYVKLLDTLEEHFHIQVARPARGHLSASASASSLASRAIRRSR
jgi:hypothetical protein